MNVVTNRDLIFSPTYSAKGSGSPPTPHPDSVVVEVVVIGYSDEIGDSGREGEIWREFEDFWSKNDKNMGF